MPFQRLNKQAHMSIWPSVWGMFYHITCDFRCLWFCRVLSFSKCLFQHNVDTCKANWLAKWLKFVYSTFLSTDRSQSWLSAVESMDAPQCPCQWNTFYQYYRYWRQVMTITGPATESMDAPQRPFQWWHQLFWRIMLDLIQWNLILMIATSKTDQCHEYWKEQTTRFWNILN